MGGETTAFGSFVFDRRQRALLRGNDVVPIGNRGYLLLEALLDGEGAVVSKETLLERAWPGVIVEDSNLSVQIATLRRALGGDAEAMIVTVPRVGYRLVLPTAASPRAGGPPLIAVLPFTSHGREAEDAYFADGVVDDIITALSRFRDFGVLSRSSTFALRHAPDPRQAAAALGARYVLEGSLRRAGESVRVTANLVDAASGGHLWGDRFEGPAADIFAVQDHITEGVVGVVGPAVRMAEIERVRRTPPHSLDAYDLYVRAVPLVYGSEMHGYAAAIPLLERAMALDPDFALAQAFAAWCYEKRRALSLPPLGPDDKGACLALARRALALGGDDPMVMAICGWCLFIVGGDTSALALMEKARDANPNNAAVLILAGAGLLVSGKLDDAHDCYLRASRLSPGAPDAYQSIEGVGTTELVRGNYEVALEWLLRARATFNDWPMIYYSLIAAYGYLGQIGEAEAAFARLKEIAPHATSIAALVGDSGQNENIVWDALIPGLRKAGVPER